MTTTRYHHLQGTRSSLVLACPAQGLPAILYWGSRLPEQTDLAAFEHLHSKPQLAGTLDTHPPLSLVPEAGRGFLGA